MKPEELLQAIELALVERQVVFQDCEPGRDPTDAALEATDARVDVGDLAAEGLLSRTLAREPVVEVRDSSVERLLLHRQVAAGGRRCKQEQREHKQCRRESSSHGAMFVDRSALPAARATPVPAGSARGPEQEPAQGRGQAREAPRAPGSVPGRAPVEAAPTGREQAPGRGPGEAP